jgi:hypothetical protein
MGGLGAFSDKIGPLNILRYTHSYLTLRNLATMFTDDDTSI